ncbi:unnamed protein product [Clavelina lepadiformis]|uniref:Uncharacterized protein n=1 Tax=Clavelina lepadiformis TaxID=159417 RepID=A0ABP0F7V7_CLALP
MSDLKNFPTKLIPATSSATTSIPTTSATNPISTTSNIFSPAQIETKIKDLESIVSSGTSLTKQTFTEVVNTVGNLTLSRKHFKKNTTQRLLRILDQVADKVNVSDGEVFNATTPNVFVAVVNLPEANTSIDGDVYGIALSVVNHLTTGFSNESFSLHYEETKTNQSNIFIPYEVINKSKDGKVSFYSFLGESLFYSNTSTNAIEEDAGYEESFVNSHVVLSATILDPEVSTENLTEKIKLSFRVNENTSIFGSSFCGFWVEDGSYWSSESCTKLSSSEQLLRCECNHLTNFASLFAYGSLTHDKGLDILTYVGCSISAIASLLMIIALFIIWKSTKVQMRQSTKFVMLNLSFSLFLLNILILISEIPGVRSDEGKCKAAAGTLHFALISAFLWMFAQAVPVFISIIKPIYFRVYFSSKKFVISFFLLGWGLPLILVVLIGSIKPEWYVNQVNDVNPDKTPKIQGQFRCWIVPDMMIYLVIIPAAVLLSGNVLLYVFSTAKYLLQKRPGEKPIKRREGQLKTNLKFSVTLFVMFGITWIFGFLIFNSSDVSLAFAYIFTIFNSLQGFALFIIFIQRNGMKENIWESLLKLTPRPSVVSNSRVTEQLSPHCFKYKLKDMILIHLTMKMMRCLLLLILLFIPTILAQDAAHTRYICEHEAPQQVSCPPHYVIDVIDAFYGRLEKNRCRWNDNDHCRAPNSQSIIEGNCQDKMSCVLRAHNDVFGDPCVSVTKYVKIEYNCIITVDCGFESATEPFCNYENVGWERSSRGIPKGGKYFLAKYSYIPEATLTLKENTSEDLELSFWFWRQTEGDYTFRLIQISGSIEDELWRQQNKEATSYEQVNGIKVKKGAILKLIATGNAVIYLDKIASVATTPIWTIPISTTSTILIPNEIDKKIKDLESIVFTKTSLTKEDSTKVVEVLGNLNSPGKNYRPNTTQKLLRILDQVANKVNVSDGEVFNATTPNVFVAVVNLPEVNSTNGGDVYGVELSVVNHLATGFSNESFSLHYEEKDTNQSNIFIPYEVINKSKDGKVSFYSFLGDSFSHTNASTNTVEEDTGFEESFVNSHVVLSATILDPEVSTENLTEKIKLSFRVNENTSIFGSSFCGFWVEDGSYWSSKGCTKLPSSEQLLRCECNHLTNFASLFAYGNLTHDKGLDILTYVGCSISAIASLLMIIALLILWKSTKVQMRQTTKFVMLNLSFSLFLLNILILISEIPGVRSDEGKCKAAAGTLHFALISAFLWMFAQAVPVFISIIKPMYFRVHFSSKKFVISFLFLGWGLPLVLVVLIGSLKPEWYVNQVNDVNPDKTPKIQGQFRCWIVPDMMIYLVIIPAAVLLSLNFLLFVLAIIKYLLLKRPGEKSSKRREGQLKTNLKFSVTLFVMFGITWIFGFLIFNSSDVSLAFAYIFTIFNSLQGFALFIIFIRRKGMKQNLEESLLKLTSRPSAVSNSRVTEERTFVTFSNTTQA